MLRVDHVQLAAPAQCVAAARAFFGSLLGLPEIPKQTPAGRGGAWFQAGNIELHVGVQAHFQPAKKAHVALAVAAREELDTLAERLSAAGHPIRWDAHLPGVDRFFTNDPWGNRMELMFDRRTP